MTVRFISKVFDSLMVRHWDTWNCYNKRNHVFVCPLSVSASGHLSAGCDTNLVDLMKGLTSDCPPKPFGGAEEYAASPGGDAVVMTCRRVAESLNQPTDMSWSTEGIKVISNVLFAATCLVLL